MDTPAAALERYLRGRIPVCAALGVRVAQAGPECVRLTAPLAANVNHSGTVFGGSAAAIATLAAWSLLHLRLEAAGLRARTMIQRNDMEYERPIAGDFEAECRLTDEPAWERFAALLKRRGRARLHLEAQLRCRGEPVGRFAGEFVALGAAFSAPDPPETPA
ncbi:MAG: YiiD C-terminal domain-containing protein [Steroidobacteraceae bacterium]